MPVLILIMLASFVAGCLSSSRTREVYCLGQLMMDVSESFETVQSIEVQWRTTQQPGGEQTISPGSPVSPVGTPFVIQDGQSSVPMHPVTLGRLTPTQNFSAQDELYRHLAEARRLHRDNLSWYSRVSRRVQTRLDEDEMLYGVLGMAVSAPAALLFYPIIRWNIRSVLWDETDPDAETDPVQRFCLARLDAMGMGSGSE
jgi:hypothetical protein